MNISTDTTFDVYTDNNPLTYVLMTAKLDAMGHSWVISLANYNFHLHYQSGRSNVEADALSRINWGKNDKTLPADSIQAIVTAGLQGKGMIILRPFLAVPKPLTLLPHLSMPRHR